MTVKAFFSPDLGCFASQLKSGGAEKLDFGTNYDFLGVDKVVVYGGSQSALKLARDIMRSSPDTKLAIIPCGKNNTFAYGLGMENLPSPAAEEIVREVDVGVVNDEYLFFNNLDIGFDATVPKRFPNGVKNHKLQFLLAILAAPNFYARINIDGKETTTNCMNISVGNTDRVGPFTFKGASPFDGQLNYAVQSGLVGRIFASYSDSFREMTLETEPEVGVRIDGDEIIRTPIKISLLEQKLKFLCPQK